MQFFLFKNYYYQVWINIVVNISRKSTFITIEKIYCYEQNEEHGANTWKCKPNMFFLNSKCKQTLIK